MEKFVRRFHIMHRHIRLLVLLVFTIVSVSASARSNHSENGSGAWGEKASITFRNRSSYTMTIKILYLRGGLYQTVVLGAGSSKSVAFGRSDTFKLKIKATLGRHTSYHKGDYFSVTCTPTEWTEGEISFMMASYGDGLGPKISSKEFESND